MKRKICYIKKNKPQSSVRIEKEKSCICRLKAKYANLTLRKSSQSGHKCTTFGGVRLSFRNALWCWLRILWIIWVDGTVMFESQGFVRVAVYMCFAVPVCHQFLSDIRCIFVCTKFQTTRWHYKAKNLFVPYSTLFTVFTVSQLIVNSCCWQIRFYFHEEQNSQFACFDCP